MESHVKGIRQVEKFLQHRNNLFKELSIDIFGTLYVTDSNGIITYISSTASDLFGYSAEEMTGHSFDKFLAKSSIEKAIGAFQNVLNSNQQLQSIILEMKRKDGSTFWGKLNSKVIFKQNQPVGTSGMISDVTTHVLHENAINKRNRLLQALNYYSLKLATTPNDQLLPFIGKRLIEKLNSTVAWISFYNHQTSCLVIQHMCSAKPDDTFLDKFISDNLNNGIITVDDKNLKRLMQYQYLLTNSFNDITLGSIPDKASDLLVRHYNLQWFMSLALTDNDKILGTMFVAGEASQPIPEKYEVMSFAGVTANAIKRLNAEERLSKTSERFHKLVKYSSDFVEILDADGNEQFISGSVEQITGYTPEEVIGSNAYFNIHPDDVPLLKKLHMGLLNKPDEKFKAEYRLKCKDGRWKYLEAVASNLLDDPVIKGIIVNVRDISDRKNTEIKLAESEELYRLVVQNANDLIIISQDNVIVFANRKTLDLLGFHEKDLLDTSLMDIIHPDDISETIDRHSMIENGIVPPKSYTRIKTCGNKTIQTEVYGIPISWKGQFSILSFITDVTDRYAMEVALKKSEFKFRTYFEKSPVAVTTADNDGFIMDVNPAACKLLGYSKNKLVNMNLTDLIHPLDKEMFYESYKMLLESGQAKSSFRCITADRREIWLDTLVARLGKNESIGFSHDVSHQKYLINILAAQKELADAISQSQSLDEIMKLCLSIAIEISGMDCGGIYLLNPISGVFELKTHVGLSDRFIRAVSNFDMESPQAILLNKKESHYFSLRDGCLPLTPDEKAECLNAIAVIPIVHQNQTIGSLNIASHLLDECPINSRLALETLAGEISTAIVRQQISARLNERDENLNVFFNSVQDAFFILNTNGDILDINPITCSMLHYKKDDLLGKNIADIFDSENAAQVIEHINNCKNHGALEFTSSATANNHHSLILETRLTSGYWNGKAAIFAIARDITERIRSEQERLELERKLLQSQKLESLGLMASGVAHDFNNVLMNISGQADLCLLKIPDTAPASQYIKNIQKSVIHATELTRQMMAYAGKASFVKQNMNIESMLKSIQALIGSTIGINIDFRVTIEPNLPSIYADPNQIKHVIMNLVINASEAIGQKTGLIALDICTIEPSKKLFSPGHPFENLPHDTHVLFKISDNGCGMDIKLQERIFEPFYTTKMTGRGLGLSSVLGIVKGHNGKMFLESEPGKGTTFEIVFPTSRHIVPGETAISPSAKPHPELKGTLLIADDDMDVLNICEEMVNHLGYKTITAINGMNAIEEFQKNKAIIDLVMLDLTMPDMSGIEVFKKLKQIDEKVKGVLVSGFSNDKIPAKGNVPGLAGFLVKPFSFSKLRQVLSENMPNQSDKESQSG